MKIKQSQ